MTCFYTMKFRHGPDAARTDTAERVKALIEERGVVVWEEPFNVACKQGDYLVVRAEGRTLCLLKVLSSEEEVFECGDDFADFYWANHAKHVRVLSWYDEDQERFQLPTFDWRGWVQRCQEVQASKRQEQLQNWLQKCGERQ